MRVVRLLAAAFLLGYPEVADAVRSGGHNPPTRKLEVAFKVAGGVRAGSKNGCYAPPRRMAALVRHWGRLDREVARGFGGVRQVDVVYVIGSRSSCERMVFGLRDRGKLFMLDRAAGDVNPRGQASNRRGAEAHRFGRGPLRHLTVTARTFAMRKPHRAKRLVIRCPRGSFPLGGGMANDLALALTGRESTRTPTSG